jgi:hypothetical protein
MRSSRGSVPAGRAGSQRFERRLRGDFEAAAASRVVPLHAYRLPVVRELPAPRVAASRTNLSW